jgi:GNAT superfamily N-acetyltransferase
MLREPWKYPIGSEKDEYEQVSQHRMIRNPAGDVIAVGRVHMNSAEEAQVRHVAVEKSYQGKGLAKMLVASLEAVARSEGAVRMVTNSTQASLNKNINLHGTMFAGSIFSLATLTGWGMIFLKLKEKGLDGKLY